MANPIKSHKGIILIVGLVSFFIFENLAFAQTRVFVEEYTYQQVRQIADYRVE